MIITTQFIYLLIIAIILAVVSLIIDLSSRNRTAKIWHRLFGFLILLAIIGMGAENFPATLTILVAGTGLIALIDLLFFRRRRNQAQQPQPFITEQAYSFFGVLLLVWVIRSFLIQPYRVPTGSLQPTVMPGDFLVVNQYAYGLRFPVINKQFVAVGEPKRGDIALFYYPVNPNIVFVKRVIGLPGDHVEYRNKVLYINGKEMPQQDLGPAMDDEPALSGGNPEEHIPVTMEEENLAGIKHKIFVLPKVQRSAQSNDNFSIVVPQGAYFMMGDNRDNSDDSRTWGFVPEANLIGNAFGIWMSWDALTHRPRFDRIGLGVK